MNKKLAELTDLINMMTAPEKRRFMAISKSVLHSKNGQLPVGLLIFQALQAMNTYDERVFYKKLEKSIPDPAQLAKVIARLPIERLNLHNRLMHFLRSENAGYYPSMQIKELLIDAKILMERGLFDLSQQALDEARKKALEYENSLALLEINREQRTLAYSRVKNSKVLNTMLVGLIKEADTQYKLLAQEIYYQDLYDLTVVHTNKDKGIIEDEETMNKLTQAKPLLNHLESLPNLSGYRLLGAFAHLSTAQRISKVTNKITQQIAQWWEDHPHLIRENPFRYMLSMGNALMHMVNSKNKDGFFSLRDKLKKQIALLPHQGLAEFRYVNRLELFWYMNDKNMDKLYRKTKEVEVGLKKYGAVLPPRLRITTLYNFGVAYFIYGKFREALGVFNRLLRNSAYIELQKLQNQSELLSLICVYELSANKSTAPASEDVGSDTLNNRFKRINRMFKRQGLTENSFEMTLLAFHKQIMYAHWEKRKEAIMAMKNYLLPLNDPHGKAIDGVNEHLAWLESLIQNRNIRLVYPEMSH